LIEVIRAAAKPAALHSIARAAAVLFAAPLSCAAVPAQELPSYKVVGDGIPVSLTGERGVAQRGKAVAANSNQGNCIICHQIPIPEVPAGAFGDLGPPLAGVASRLSEAELRLRIVDPKVLAPDSIMPAYYRIAGLQRVSATHAGKPILSAREVEDLIAFLLTLTEAPR
jgi:sulfur-oxidizing protein SoxX